MSEFENLLKALSEIQGKTREKTEEPRYYLVFDNTEIPREIVKKIAKIDKPIILNKDGIAIIEKFFGTRNRKVLTQRLVLYLLALQQRLKEQ